LAAERPIRPENMRIMISAAASLPERTNEGSVNEIAYLDIAAEHSAAHPTPRDKPGFSQPTIRTHLQENL